MTARSFLVRGLLAGLLAGIVTFLVAHTVGEPSVERAIALEETAAPSSTSATDRNIDRDTDGHTHDHGSDHADEGAAHTHSHDDEALVSRSTQSTWGLLTGTVAVGIALGGILALVAAGVVGRLGRASAAQSTAVVALIGFVSFALVPFVKYPANPPDVGRADTIGERTGWYFLFVLVSVLVAVAATVLALRLRESQGTYVGVLAGLATYLAVVVTVGQLLPSVDEVGDFPASTLWSFRLASLITLATLWAALGIGLSGLVGRLHHRETALAERRALAASL